MPRSKPSIDAWLIELWRGRGVAAWLLLPFALIFAALSALRRLAYRAGLLPARRAGVPVVVVGNIVAGGAGKTPLTLYLAQQLTRLGRRPGIISRGYGGDAATVREVLPGSDPRSVGDEPLLLKCRFGGPVFVGRRRLDAALALRAAHPQCDVIISDDGLQHYALARDLEIAVLDRRGTMNGWPLPAGPLREPVRRLGKVGIIVLNGVRRSPVTGPAEFHMRLEPGDLYALDNPAQICAPASLSGLKLHAVAGIANPQRFFDQLLDLGLSFEAHAFPDHHRYSAADLDYHGDAILATEKDAVKFAGLAKLPVWVLPVQARVEPDLARFVQEKLNGSASA